MDEVKKIFLIINFRDGIGLVYSILIFEWFFLNVLRFF